jgi:hypothetical protein
LCEETNLTSFSSTSDTKLRNVTASFSFDHILIPLEEQVRKQALPLGVTVSKFESASNYVAKFCEITLLKKHR